MPTRSWCGYATGPTRRAWKLVAALLDQTANSECAHTAPSLHTCMHTRSLMHASIDAALLLLRLATVSPLALASNNKLALAGGLPRGRTQYQLPGQCSLGRWRHWPHRPVDNQCSLGGRTHRPHRPVAGQCSSGRWRCWALNSQLATNRAHHPRELIKQALGVAFGPTTNTWPRTGPTTSASESRRVCLFDRDRSRIRGQPSSPTFRVCYRWMTHGARRRGRW